MEWHDVGEAVKKYAPVLGSAIGGPAGGAVGGAVSLLLGAFGLGGDATPDDVSKLLTDPTSILKMKELEQTYQVELGKLALQHDQAYLADRQGARSREVDIAKATGSRDLNLYILAWVVVAGFFALTWTMMYVDLPPANLGPVNILFGALVAGFTGVLGYFFGSSQSSDIKTKMMTK